jgi:hypothetical protein
VLFLNQKEKNGQIQEVTGMNSCNQQELKLFHGSFFETSACTNENVAEAFSNLFGRIVDKLLEKTN